MKKQFLKECSTCCGHGTVAMNDSWDEHPSHDYSVTCEECNGEGHCIDSDLLNERIEDVEWMIEGMLTRIRITSDAVKSCNKGMLERLEAKYRNQLHTQARALARLETYLSNLKTY